MYAYGALYHIYQGSDFVHIEYLVLFRFAWLHSSVLSISVVKQKRVATIGFALFSAKKIIHTQTYMNKTTESETNEKEKLGKTEQAMLSVCVHSSKQRVCVRAVKFLALDAQQQQRLHRTAARCFLVEKLLANCLCEASYFFWLLCAPGRRPCSLSGPCSLLSLRIFALCGYSRFIVIGWLVLWLWL